MDRNGIPCSELAWMLQFKPLERLEGSRPSSNVANDAGVLTTLTLCSRIIWIMGILLLDGVWMGLVCRCFLSLGAGVSLQTSEESPRRHFCQCRFCSRARSRTLILQGGELFGR